MLLRALTCAIVIAALTGCDKPALTADKEAVDWKGCSTGGGLSANPARCKVKITVDGDCPGATVKYDKPDLSLSGSGHTFIIWTLPANYRFCPAQGDGAFLKFFDTTDQFSDPAATNDPEGNTDADAAKCKKHFRLRDANEIQTAGTTYKYRIQFTDRNNKTCTTDPQIRNG